MTVRGQGGLAHRLTHRHTRLEKAGVGEFSICERTWLSRRASVVFRPDFDASRWHPVPYAEDGEGRTVLERMLEAGSSYEAMRLLRSARAEDGTFR